jgi:microcystin-dependent protein
VAEPFIAQISIISFNFPPRGWAFCNGQLLPINQNQALFSLLGTTYGGDGRVNFALPNLQGRAPVHATGGAVVLGEAGGEVNHTLQQGELPQHTHPVMASNNQATASTPGGNVLAVKDRRGKNVYGLQPDNSNARPLNAAAVSTASGGSPPQPHNNTQPSLVLNFVIALAGVFPSRN